MKKLLYIVFLVLWASLAGFSQNSTQGKEFWISFMQNGYRHYDYNHPEWVETKVMIGAKRACTGVVRKADGTGSPITFSVAADNIVILDIPESWAYNEGNDEVIDNKAIVLTTTDTVSVFISNVAIYSFDASFVLPVESLGSEYIIQTDQQSWSGGVEANRKETSAFLIIAVEDDTEVEITPSVATVGGHGAGVPFTVAMSAGQTYSVRSNHESENWRDLSGSTIFAHDGKKIAVFNGNTFTRIPNQAPNGRDHIFEQALPFDSWGRRFVVTTSEGRPRDIVKITSAADDNVIYRDGEEVAIIGFGDTFEFEITPAEGSCFIETSEPSVVYLYHTSWGDPFQPSSSRIGDPSMVWIPPVEQRIKEITFCTFNSTQDLAYISNHYLNIVVHQLDADKVYLDGELIDEADFQPVCGSDEFRFVRKEIGHGVHHLSCESGLIGHVYGFGESRGYAYCVGANVLNINGKLYVNGLWSGFYRDGLYMCNGESVTLGIVANYAVNQVDWSFGDGQTAQGMETSHVYEVGEYLASAHVSGYNTLTLEPVDDTMSIAIHVGEPDVIVQTYRACDSIEVDGQVYYESYHYEAHGTNIYGCDSSYFLTIDIPAGMPSFEMTGNHWPMGGTEVQYSVNQYAIQLDNPQVVLDTVLWLVDCPNWRLEPHGKGETCTLYIHSYLTEPVMLHATAVNACDSVHHEFFIQTSYYDVGESDDMSGFELFPNPTDGSLTLRFGNLTGLTEIAVYNEQGQQVDAFSLDVTNCKQTIYSFPDCSDGLYFLTMKNNGKTRVRKVSFQR